ncbi:MAG: DUF3450 family protein [Puniceicoccaceae bacterium]|nr:MAG: DUF3450 family protein [Puniceicoccaceae bacterium]
MIRTATLFSLLLAAALGLAPSSHAVDLDETRSSLQEWVETRRIISAERSQWRSERELIEESITLLKSEISLLEERIQEAEEGATVADRERERLNDENAVLREASSVVSEAMTALEGRVAGLVAYFPPTLRTNIDPLYRRLQAAQRAGDLATRASLSERMQNIIGILNAAEQFNNNILLTRELQEIPGGDTAEVRTLYVGLAVAYYVDTTGRTAGVLRPAPDGWIATARPEMAETIKRAVAIYERERLAEFIPIAIELD